MNQNCTFVAKQGTGQGDEVVPSTKSIGIDLLMNLRENQDIL